MIRPLVADMLHNAMPVLLRMEDPSRAGMFSPEDTRELFERATRPIYDELAPTPDVRAVFERFTEDLAQVFNDAGRRQGRLLAGDDPQASASPSPTPTPDTGKE